MYRVVALAKSIPRLKLHRNPFTAQVRQHSARKRLLGGATSAGTQRRFDESLAQHTASPAHAAHDHAHSAQRQVHAALKTHVRPWSTGWHASRIGFGMYRTHDHGHYHALMHALELGCNVLDTSTNYSAGASEELCGHVLEEMTQHLHVISREEVIVISKAGYVQNSILRWARDCEQRGEAIPDMVKVSDSMWYCLSPPFIEQQLTQSLARLNLDTLDVYLLHNPEHYLRPDTTMAAWEQCLEMAFAQLEKEVQRGRIQFYGISSNVWARDELSIDRLLKIAKKVNGEQHHFRVMQLPLNLLEHSALQSTAGQPSLLARAKQSNLVTLSNRPLNALVEGQLSRLVMPDLQPSGRDLNHELATAFEQALALERDYAAHREYHVPEAEINIAHTLHKHLSYFDLYKFESFIRDSAAPHLNHVLGDDSKLPKVEGFQPWLQQYQRALEQLWRTIFQRLTEQRYAQTSHVYRSAIQTPAFASRAPQLPTLSLLATNAVLSTSVDCMLIGMRTEEYVDDVFYRHLTTPLVPLTNEELLNTMKVAEEAAKVSHSPDFLKSLKQDQ